VSLCLTKYYAIKTFGEAELQLYAFLISALDRSEWSASPSARFTPGEMDAGTNE